jgi:hypothetical protein
MSTYQEQVLAQLKAQTALLEHIALLLEKQTQEWQYTPEGLPICPKHGIVMSKREKQGDTWHSHQTSTGNYCRGYRTGWPGDGFDDDDDDQTPPAAPTPTPQPTPPTPSAPMPQAQAIPPAQADQKAEPIPAGKARLTFYEIGQSLIGAGKMKFDELNDYVSIASREGWQTGLERLQADFA